MVPKWKKGAETEYDVCFTPLSVFRYDVINIRGATMYSAADKGKIVHFVVQA